MNQTSGLPHPWDDIRATNSNENLFIVAYHYGDKQIVPPAFCGSAGYVDQWSMKDGMLRHVIKMEDFCF